MSDNFSKYLKELRGLNSYVSKGNLTPEELGRTG